MSEPRRYSVVVAKDYLKFAAAHFIAYPGFREPLHGECHLPIGHAHDDEVVRVVGDGRGERSPSQAGARDEAEPDPAGREMTLDDRDLRQVVVGARDRLAPFDDRVPLERLGDDLVLDEADRAHAPPARRDREVGR